MTIVPPPIEPSTRRFIAGCMSPLTTIDVGGVVRTIVVDIVVNSGKTALGAVGAGVHWVVGIGIGGGVEGGGNVTRGGGVDGTGGTDGNAEKLRKKYKMKLDSSE